MDVRATGAGVNQATTAAPLEETGGRARASDAGGPLDRTDLSRLGSLLHTLQELEQRDPARYRRAVDSLAARLDEAAAAGPGDEAELLRGLARKFRQQGQAPAQAAATGRVAAYARTSAAVPSALEELVEASLKESTG